MSDVLRRDRPSDGVALLELARPGKLNALNAALNAALTEALRGLELEDAVRVVVIAGAGRAFSAGADLTEMRTLSGIGLSRFIEASRTPGDRLAGSSLISIAALHGHVLGGGAELALACDIRVAGEDLSFGFPEMVLGSMPGSGGMQRLPGIVGHARALELVTLGTRVSAAEAERFGIITRRATDPREEALRLAAAIAERPAASLRYAKAAVSLDAESPAAAAFHGLVSAVNQADPAYRGNTGSFVRGQGPLGEDGKC